MLDLLEINFPDMRALKILRSTKSNQSTTISDQERIKQLERENKELHRANDILRKAAAFFGQAELDRPHK